MLNEVFKNRENAFWFLNVAGWGGYTVAAYLGAITHEKPDTYIAVSVAAGLIGFLITIPMRYAYRSLWNRAPWQVAGGVLLVSYLAAATTWTG